jgi:hypothetical protein
VCVSIGDSSLQSLVSGSSNIAIGFSAGSYLQTGNNNVYISNTEVITSESNKIRLGNGQHNEVFINGIYYTMSSTGDKRSVYCDANGKLTTTFSSNVIPMGEIYYKNPVTDTRTLSIGVAAQISVPGGLFYNTQFTSPSNSQLQFTGAYTRYANINATISCVIDAGTNQLLNFELRKNKSNRR